VIILSRRKQGRFKIPEKLVNDVNIVMELWVSDHKILLWIEVIVKIKFERERQK
jgi:hypothetical protein